MKIVAVVLAIVLIIPYYSSLVLALGEIADVSSSTAKFVEDLTNSELYDIQEGLYAGDADILMNIHLRKGFGWPQVATLVIHRESGRLLIGVLFSIRDTSLGKATLVVVDEGFLRKGNPSGKIVKIDPTGAGSAFYEAYRW